MQKWICRLGVILGCMAVVTGCGTMETRMTVEQLTNARVAVEAAERVDAKKLSPENLRHAQDALAIANDAYANHDFERSFTFARRATIYARVAKAQSEQKQADEKLLASKAQLDGLRRQIEKESAAMPGAYDAVTPSVQPVLPEGAPAAAPTPAPSAVPTAAPTPEPTPAPMVSATPAGWGGK